MQSIFKEYLFTKHVFVCESADLAQAESQAFETVFSLANLFGISVTKGKDLARMEMIELAAKELGVNVPEPFYKGFPESVKSLTHEELLFDQLVHYAKTYGFGYFDEPGHSILERDYERLAFGERTVLKNFEIITEEEAVKLLATYVEGLLASSRPLNQKQFKMVCEYCTAYKYRVRSCASKNTVVQLLVTLRDLYFCRFLKLSDTIKVADDLNFADYNFNENLRKLNFRNQDRKLLTGVINACFNAGRVDLATCYEKKDLWCGLLHHLHYKPINKEAEDFVREMRTKGNHSVYAEFERLLRLRNVRGAVDVLAEGKGSGAVLRNLDYIVSRIEDPKDLSYVLSKLDSKNNLILMQLMLHYAASHGPAAGQGRTFRFARHGMLRAHREDEWEKARRKSQLPQKTKDVLLRFITENLERNLAGKLGKVYVDEDMKKIALPLQESTSQGGFGVLSKGSRLPLPEGKKLRGFTYWEKVDDIDLSVIGLDDEGGQIEFSWRTMAANQSDAICYSGDETSGYNGGSEFFDVNFDAIKELYPKLHYLVFCDNVFSEVNFEACFCKAGYMMRDEEDSGEIFEPKTVSTSFIIDCPSTFAYLFALDLEKREMVWLNCAKGGETIVAGATSLAFLLNYCEVTNVMNVYHFFELMAREMVTNPAEADVIVSDSEEVWEQAKATGDEGKKERIQSFDFERLLALMNA